MFEPDLNFEAFGDDELQPAPFTELPKGTYVCCLGGCQADEKENGVQLVFVLTDFETLEGATEFQGVHLEGRKMWMRDWIDHTSVEAKRIGRTRLTALAKAVGVAEDEGGKAKLPTVQSLAELVDAFNIMQGARLKVYVGREKDGVRAKIGSVSAA